MLVRQEALTTKMNIKDLPSSSPLPNANLVLVFGSVRRFSDGKLPTQLKERYPAAQIVGCTTSGEIGPHGVSDDSLQITAIAWDKTMQRVTYACANNMQTSAETAINLAKQLKSDSLRTVLVFSDGLHINGSELLQGFQSVLGDIPIVGGMAGDNAEFSKTLQLLNDSVEEGLVIAIGLYGDKLITASGALGGWKPYAPTQDHALGKKRGV